MEKRKKLLEVSFNKKICAATSCTLPPVELRRPDLTSNGRRLEKKPGTRLNIGEEISVNRGGCFYCNLPTDIWVGMTNPSGAIAACTTARPHFSLGRRFFILNLRQKSALERGGGGRGMNIEQ